MAGRPRGVALVSILLLVAIVTVLATSMLRAQRDSLAMAGGFLDRGQAQQYALGGEELARQLLHEDWAQDQAQGAEQDHLGEDWASEELRFEFEEGEVLLQISDLQGRINVNGMAEAGPQQDWLKRLLQELGAEEVLLAQLQDWMDENAETEPGGAEDYDYLGLERAYRTSSSRLADLSEIRLLKDMTAEDYRQLKPYLGVLPNEVSTPNANPASPPNEIAALNVNTASPRVLQSLGSGLTLDAAEDLAERRDREQGFKSPDEFSKALRQIASSPPPKAGLDVRSAYFEARIVARYQDRYSYLTSVLHRDPDDGKLRLLSRDFSRQPWPVAEAGDDDD